MAWHDWSWPLFFDISMPLAGPKSDKDLALAGHLRQQKLLWGPSWEWGSGENCVLSAVQNFWSVLIMNLNNECITYPGYSSLWPLEFNIKTSDKNQDLTGQEDRYVQHTTLPWHFRLNTIFHIESINVWHYCMLPKLSRQQLFHTLTS